MIDFLLLFTKRSAIMFFNESGGGGGGDVELSLFRQNTYLQNKKHMLTCQRWDWLL